MTSVQRILVPIDFGDSSLKALDFARMLSDRCGASLQLLHVVPCGLSESDRQQALQLEAEHRLDALLTHSDRADRHAGVCCVTGAAASAIARYAADHDADLIVMGTHWDGSTFQMAIGSVAEIVVRLAPCPVVTVKAPRQVGDASDQLSGPSGSRNGQVAQSSSVA
jgi:nucleotide-binding universal stress UspA family protein